MKTRQTRFLFSASIAVLAGLAASTAGHAQVLPSGGIVRAGDAEIVTAASDATTIRQGSDRAIIDWTDFSIGIGSSVRFENGTGSTLNRVRGSAVSSIDGLLSASGSVYLLNPNGVVIGKEGKVDVGGSFVASTLDINDADFLSGKGLALSGQSAGSIVNLGKVGALGGDIVLAARTVRNAGQISAEGGAVGLLSGQQVTLRDISLDRGKFAVSLGSGDGSVTNAGDIRAAMVELRANGGNIFALAGNVGDAITATGVSSHDGRVILFAEKGATTAQGVIEASKADRTGGFIETSGDSVNVSGAKVRAQNWLIDPEDITVNNSMAATVNASLGAGTNVTLQTTSADPSAPPPDPATGNGDITVNSALTWSTGATLTLDAYGSIHIKAPITVSGSGGVELVHGEAGDYDFGLQTDGFKGSLNFTGAGSQLSINYSPYTLLRSMGDIDNIDYDTSGNYALATSLTSSDLYSDSLVYDIFSGNFTGLGHSISDLTIDSSVANVGLFRNVGTASVRDIGLVGGAVSSSEHNVGSLVGYAGPTAKISQSYSSATVSGNAAVGGLIGYLVGGTATRVFATGAVSSSSASGSNIGGIIGSLVDGGGVTESFATGAVYAPSANNVGGLVGAIQDNVGAPFILNSYATGSVTGNETVGGLLGGSGNGTGSVQTSYSTGAVMGYFPVGGLVGYYTTASNSYWDTNTSGQPDGPWLNIVGYTTSVFQNKTLAQLGYSDAVWGNGPGLYPYLLWAQPTIFQRVSGYVYESNGTTPLASANVDVYAGGSLLNSGISAGANGYYYALVADGSVSGTTKLGAVARLAGTASTDADALTFTDQPTLTDGDVTDLNLYIGQRRYSTLAPTLSELNNDLIATFGAAHAGFSSSLSNASTVLQSNHADDFTINAALNVASGSTLTISGLGNLHINSTITAAGTGGVVLTTGEGDDYDFGLEASGFSGRIGYTGSGGSLTVNGTAFSLLYSMSDLAALGASGDYTGHFALANSLDAGGTTYTSAVISNSLQGEGTFSGMGNTISNLKINSSSSYVGLFANVTGYATVRDLGLVSGSITGGGDNVGALAGRMSHAYVQHVYSSSAVSATRGNYVGGLIGNAGNVDITESFATGSVRSSGGTGVGGLVGWLSLFGSVVRSYATGTVSGSSKVGGLVGWLRNGADVTQSYAWGNVSGSNQVGGLVGQMEGLAGTDIVANAPRISESYSTGMVTGSNKGGLLGVKGTNGGTVTNSYWNTQTSGLSASAGGTGMTTAQLQSGGLPTGFSDPVWYTSAGLYPTLSALPTAEGQTISGYVFNTDGATPLSGANVDIYTGGSILGSAVSAGADGYYYITTTPATLATSTTMLGAVARLNGTASTAADAMAFIDRPLFSGADVVNLDLYIGQRRYDTDARYLSDMNTDIAATFGAGYSGFQSSLADAAMVIRANNPTDFTVDAGINIPGFVRIQSQGDLKIASATSIQTSATNSAGGNAALTLAANGSFINNGTGANLSTPNGRWLVYSQAQDDNTSMPTASDFGDLVGKSFYGDAYDFTDGTFASAANSGNRFVYGHQPMLTVTADTKELEYSGSPQANSYAITGMLDNGDIAADAYSGAPSSLTSSSKDLGDYEITPTLGTLTSDLNYGFDFAPGTLTIIPKTLTATISAGLSGAVAKVYDGTNRAVLQSSQFALTGGVDGEDVSLELPVVAFYNNENVGTGKLVTTNVSLKGANKDNYVLASSTISANIGTITKRALDVALVGAITKIYDGTRTAVLSAANYTVTGILPGDAVVLNDLRSGTYDTDSAGTGKLVTVMGLRLSGGDAGNYSIASSISGKVGTIDPKTITVRLAGSTSKVYDGSLVARLASSNLVINGAITGDSLGVATVGSAAYDTKNVGTGKMVTVTLSLTGLDKGNYRLALPTVSAPIGIITARPLTLTIKGSVTVPGGTATSIRLDQSNIALSGLVMGDAVLVSAVSLGGVKNVKNGAYVTIQVPARNVQIVGPDARNYSLSGTTTGRVRVIY